MGIERKAKTAGRLGGESGLALAEVLIASLIIGIVLIGLALMVSWSQALVVGQGDSQVVLFLAEQKLEKLRVWGFDGAQVLNWDDALAIGGCTDDEPCYTETIHTGAGGAAQGQRFTRRTCVDYVDRKSVV